MKKSLYVVLGLSVLLLTVSSVYFTSSAQSIITIDSTWAYQNQNQQNTGYSSQILINIRDAPKLKPLWSTAIDGLSGTPVIVNGIVYVTGAYSINAVNETTGQLIWSDSPTTGLAEGEFSTDSGVTIDQGNLFAGTQNNTLVSLNARTGALVWTTNILQNITGSTISQYQGAQATPLVYNGKVIVGETVGSYGARGVLQAFSETNGKLLWSFFTVPPVPINATNQAPWGNTWGTNGTGGCYCSGGDVWGVPAVDPSTGIIYFGTGNPFPWGIKDTSARTPGYPNTNDVNLCTDCIIALNSATGKLVWYYQAVPADQYDYDVGMPVQLFTTKINGIPTEVVGAGGKIGDYWLLNARTGALIWEVAVSLQLNDRAPAGSVPSSEIFPSGHGGITTFSSYNPFFNLIYTMGYNQPTSCALTPTCPQDVNSTLDAIDASTGVVVWHVTLQGLGGGASSTNELVFTSDGNHHFYALNGLNGKVVWELTDPSGGNAGTPWWSWGPPSFTNGKMFVTTMGMGGNGFLEAYTP